MKDRVNIGIIDSGIDKNDVEKGRISKEYCFNYNSSSEGNDVDENINSLKHGTICALVIEKYCPNSRFLSARILNNNGRGTIYRIESSLDVCNKNNVKLVNISLGTTHFQDKRIVRRTVNHYANKGMILVAATSNDGKTTYPASLSNVISVAVGEDVRVDQNVQHQTGIDFIAPSDHEITMEGVSFRLGQSNSYAAPYITALVGNLISAKGSMTVDEIRDQLCEGGNSFIYAPDWIESAWITPDYKRSKEEYYFAEDTRNLQECIDDIDTIVLSNSENIDKYADLGKHIVYIGKDNIQRSNKKYHFWSRELRREQIMSSKKKFGELDIPTIYCIFDNQIDVIWCLCELKSLFAYDGYNAFAGYSSEDSILYDLEYLPDEDVIQEKLVDFVYWQTYYQQSDLVLIGAIEKDSFINKPDMKIYFNAGKDGISIRMVYDENAESKKYYDNLEVENIKNIYEDILSRFKKEDE